MTIKNDESTGGVDDRHLDHPHFKDFSGAAETEASDDATNDLEPTGGVTPEGGTESMSVPNTSEGSEEGFGSTVLGEEEAEDDKPFGLVVMELGEAEDHDGDSTTSEAMGAAIFES